MKAIGKGFGRVQRRREKLEHRRDRLRELNAWIPWELFLPLLANTQEKERKSNAGRKPINRLLLFKMLILQQLYNLGDDEVEYQTHDRASFRRFVGLDSDEEVPDSTTLWLFREQLTQAGLLDELFEQFSQYLEQSGYQAQGGQIIDATFIPVPIQRNTRQENEQIKVGETPPHWQENCHKSSQKDTDARWTKKGGSVTTATRTTSI